jgi:hypothetical protein
MLIGISRPMSEPPYPTPDIDMGLIGQAAEQLGFSWISYGHHTVRPLEEPIVGPHTRGVRSSRTRWSDSRERRP